MRSTFSHRATGIDTGVTGDYSGQMVNRFEVDVIDRHTGDGRHPGSAPEWVPYDGPTELGTGALAKCCLDGRPDA